LGGVDNGDGDGGGGVRAGVCGGALLAISPAGLDGDCSAWLVGMRVRQY
jgi:hypothetical protein